MIFEVKKFIVKRYELETNILDTIAFKEHAVFTRLYLPFFHLHYIPATLRCVYGGGNCIKIERYFEISMILQLLLAIFRKKKLIW